MQRSNIRTLTVLTINFVILSVFAACNLTNPVDELTAQEARTLSNETVWRDTNGNKILAQGGTVTKVEGTYYWIGAEFPSDNYRFSAVKCYASSDLKNWRFVNDVLSAQPSGELSSNHWVGRPDVIHNALTDQYVMYAEWAPIDPQTTRNLVGVATSDSICGPYTWRGASQVLGRTVGDHSLFKDQNGNGYLVYVRDAANSDPTDSDTWNIDLAIARLTSDYLGIASQTFTGYAYDHREAPTILKKGATYYWFTSGTDWWNSTETKYATATSLSGPWTYLKTLPTYPLSSNSFNSQVDFVLPVRGSSGVTHMYAGDRWSNFTNQGTGRYVWLPLTFSGATPQLEYFKNWRIDTLTGNWSPSSEAEKNFINNPGFEENGVTQTPSRWLTWTGNASVDADYTEAGGRSGSYKLTHWKGSNYQVYTYQTITGLPTGTYSLEASVLSNGGQTGSLMEIKDYGNTKRSVNIPTANNWTRIVIDDISVTSGVATVGFWSEAKANQWMNVDDVAFYKK